MYNHDHRESSSERLFSLSYFLLFRAMSVRAGKQYISWQKCLSSESRAESDEPWYGAMTDRNAERRCPATSMSRRAGRGGPLDEGRRRRHTGWSRLCHLAGIVKPCGRGHLVGIVKACGRKLTLPVPPAASSPTGASSLKTSTGALTRHDDRVLFGPQL